MNKTVGVFILHYVDDQQTDACVAAFLEQFVADLIVVIDNGSPIPYAAEEGVEVVRLDKNIPVVDAWNAGMITYPADVYFLANNDALPADGCLDTLVRTLEDESIGIVAPGTSDETVGMMHVPQPDASLASIDMSHVDGHLWGWRQDLVDAIGYPDADGHTHQMCWGSNRDYCYRARKAGFRVVCVRSAWVDHEHKESYDRGEANAAGRAWVAGKWGEEAPLVEA